MQQRFDERRALQLKAGRWRQDKRVYEDWMEKEGIPVYQAFAGIEDITELPRRPWARLGGLGTFIELEGTKQARKLCYVAEIPGGGALEPEKHLYDELIYIIQGRGLTEVWQEGQPKRTFEWGEGSVFAMPLNAWHRLVNGGRQPVLIFGQTSAPLMMNALHNTEFIFNCDYIFTTRYRDYNVIESYTGQDDYFQAREVPPSKIGEPTLPWKTNFIPDVRTAVWGDPLDDETVPFRRVVPIEMGWWTTLHATWWPVGQYLNAHSHGPGAILLCLRGEGYVLLWHPQYGIHPYQDGHGDKVTKFDWKVNSIYSPPSEWFHQHHDTGGERGRHLADTGGGLGIELPTLEETTGKYGWTTVKTSSGQRSSYFHGIAYEDEDPEIRRMFEEELRKKGVKCTMPPVTYRT